MSWFKTLKKTRKNFQHPPSSNIVSQTGAGPSSVSSGLNQTVESGGALRSAKQISSVSPLQQIQTTEILPGVIAKLRVSFGKRKGLCVVLTFSFSPRETPPGHDTRGSSNFCEERKGNA